MGTKWKYWFVSPAKSDALAYFAYDTVSDMIDPDKNFVLSSENAKYNKFYQLLIEFVLGVIVGEEIEIKNEDEELIKRIIRHHRLFSFEKKNSLTARREKLKEIINNNIET